MPTDLIKIATRSSKLALWQSEHVKARLEAAFPELRVELVLMTTKGDRIQSVSLSKVGDKGLFTLELEEALRDGRADIAVHSLKDLPTQLHSDFAIHAILERADQRDLLISTKECASGLDSLLKKSRLGTSSLRRRAQALALRPDLTISDLRGNVDTRLEKLKRGDHDAIILAAAGLKRLNFVDQDGKGKGVAEGLFASALDTPWLPAVAQGAIAIEGRAGDQSIATICSSLNCRDTNSAVSAERAFMRRLEGGCQAPVAAWARKVEASWHIDGAVFSLDGREVIRKSSTFDRNSAVQCGEALAEEMLEAGAASIMDSARQANSEG